MPLSSLTSPGHVEAQFAQVTDFLLAHRSLWQERPFVDRDVAWSSSHPGLHRWFSALPVPAIDAAESGHFPEDLPREARALQEQADAVSALPSIHSPPTPELVEAKRPRRIPGRKWLQIRAFADATLPELGDAEEIVDWCSGKGHLGRTLAQLTDAPFHALERDPFLCDRGTEEATRWNAEGHFHPVDVRSPAARNVIRPSSAVVGLHPCGVLSEELLEASCERGAAVSIHAPCCYHALGGLKTRRSRSPQAQKAGLELTSEQLRLATTDEVVARPSIRDARRRELSFRQGLDLLLREASGEDLYRNQGPFPRSLLDLPFEQFCHEASRRLQRPLPMRWDPVSAEAAGAERSRESRALGLVRGLFRRVMEVHVVLDRALWMLDEGMAVQLGTFCSREVTPRNIWMTCRPGDAR